MNRNLCKTVLSYGGSLTPILISTEDSKGLGLMNPSIFIDGEKLLLNLRNVNYTLYHCENGQLFNNRYGPLAYLNPDNDIHLRTTNFLCILDNDLSVKKHFLVDTLKLDQEPVWEFVGLEDTRLVRWNGRLFMCGVRRDTKTNGEGRMELSEITISRSSVKEKSRNRIQPPNDPKSYCEKNWMPILDMPFHFVKWTNPTEVVKVNLENNTSETVFLDPDFIENLPDLRGSSQVISWRDYRICIVHDCDLFKNKMGQKDATYMHRFIVWDKEWNIIKISKEFSFMTGEIEFCCGLALYKEDLLISFGFQDNAAYLLRVPGSMIEDFLGFSKEGFDFGDNKLFLSDIMQKEIFEKRIYERTYCVKEGDIVMDIGANVGAFTYSIFDKNPKHVYCIEPSNRLIDTLIKNTDGHPVTIINKAISEYNELDKEVETGVYIYGNNGNKYDAITFERIISDNEINEIDFLKVDCEGGEYSIFTEENKNWIINNVKHIAVEFHLWGVSDAVNKFMKFRDLYLKGKNFDVIVTKSEEDVRLKIFNDKFVTEFSETKTHAAQLMVYIDYE